VRAEAGEEGRDDEWPYCPAAGVNYFADGDGETDLKFQHPKLERTQARKLFFSHAGALPHAKPVTMQRPGPFLQKLPFLTNSLSLSLSLSQHRRYLLTWKVGHDNDGRLW
jgi:hypothetical protein